MVRGFTGVDGFLQGTVSLRWARAVVGMVLCVFGASAWAQQCMDWRGVPELTRADIIEAATVWDPDGAGPLPPRLVVAGRFAAAGWNNASTPGGIGANSIAMWDGTTWQSLGLGLTGNPIYATVYCLAVFNGELYAGGTFTSAGGSAIGGIARWNGTQWRPLGSGLAAVSQPNAFPVVYSMAVYNGELVVAGSFLTAGGITMNNIARWNGTSWNPASMAGGVSSGISSLVVHNGELYAGGSFTTIGGVAANMVAKWNPGGSWSAVGSAVAGGGIDPVYHGSNFTTSAEVYTLGSYGGELIVGGRFTHASGVPTSGVARWNGTVWRSLGDGVQPYDPTFDGMIRFGVRSLQVYAGQLFVGGRFGFTGNSPINNVASWNGSGWSRLNDGLSSYPSAFGDEGVYAFATFNNRLFAGGIFVNSGSTVLQGLSEWNGTAWLASPGVLYSYSAQTYALAPWAGQMVVGGDFDIVWTPGSLQWDLVKWDGLGLSNPGFAPSWSVQNLLPSVRAVAAYTRTSGLPTEDLYVGGDFDQFSTGSAVVSANRIAKVNSLVGGWEAMAAGFNGTVNAITRFNGSIYAAGGFTASGAAARNRIARWDGTLWQPVVNQPTAGVDGTNDAIRAMVGYSSGVRNVVLAVGGDFTTAGGVAASRVAQFTVSTLTASASWSAMGAGFNGTVNALARFNGSTYAGGNFTLSGSTAVSHIARWDGTAWQPVGAGVNGAVYAMTVSSGTLVVGGSFTSAGGVAETENIARWDGTAWSSIGLGVEGTVRALSTINGELHVGGQFTTVRNASIATMGYARFLETGVPWFARSPSIDGFQCANNTITIGADIADGYSVSTYAWRRNGVPVVDGPTGSGSVVSGAHTRAMTISNVGFADNGDYDLAVTSACGNVASSATTLRVCVADMDSGNGTGGCDGGVTIDDLLYFLDIFGQGNIHADIDDGSGTGTRDGGVTIDDLLFFLQHFSDGC